MNNKGYYQKRLIWSIAGALLALGGVVLSIYRIWQGNTSAHLISISGVVLGFFFLIYSHKSNALGIVGVLLLIAGSIAMTEVHCDITPGGLLSRFVSDIKDFELGSFLNSVTFLVQMILLLTIAVLFSSSFLYCGRRKVLIVLISVAVALRVLEVVRVYFTLPRENAVMDKGYIIDVISLLSLEIALLLFVAGVKRIGSREKIDYNMYNMYEIDAFGGFEDNEGKEKEWQSLDSHSPIYNTGIDYKVPVLTKTKD